MIPLLDLKKQYNAIKDELKTSLHDVLESGNFILGAQVKALEEEIAEYSGVKFGIGVASGTDALELALRALDIGPGDEVITSPFTFIATSEVINQVGAKLIFVDIDSDTYNIDPAGIAGSITNKTRALIPVHLYGQPCRMDAIMELAHRNKLFVIEDCAQAIGAEYKGRKVGSFGAAGCFSFFPTKNLGAYGDGGMVVTDDSSLSDKIRMLRAHGAKDKYFHILEGTNSRLDEIQAAVLRVKFRYLDKWNEQRRRRAEGYDELFIKKGLKDKVSIPKIDEGARHVFHLYVARVKDRDSLVNFLKSKKISTAVHYPLPLHLQEVYKHTGYGRGDFPNAESAAREVISLPLYPEISIEEISYIVSCIAEFYAR